MPGYKGHLVGGAIAFSCLILASKTWHQPTLFLAVQYFFCSLLGSLFPDIDTKSRGQGIFYRMFLVLVAVLLYRSEKNLCIILSLLAITPLLVRHRGLFHRPWFITVIPFACALICGQIELGITQQCLWYASYFVMGAWSHILFDRMF